MRFTNTERTTDGKNGGTKCVPEIRRLSSAPNRCGRWHWSTLPICGESSHVSEVWGNLWGRGQVAEYTLGAIVRVRQSLRSGNGSPRLSVTFSRISRCRRRTSAGPGRPSPLNPGPVCDLSGAACTSPSANTRRMCTTIADVTWSHAKYSSVAVKAGHKTRNKKHVVELGFNLLAGKSALSRVENTRIRILITSKNYPSVCSAALDACKWYRIFRVEFYCNCSITWSIVWHAWHTTMRPTNGHMITWSSIS